MASWICNKLCHVQELRWNGKLVLWVAFMMNVLFLSVHAQEECKKINDCRCKLPNGKLIDISKIGNKDGKTPKFDYAKPDDGSSVFYEYSFNGCYGYSDGFCSNAVACQRSVRSQEQAFSLGTPDSANYTDGSEVIFSAVGQDGQLRYASIKLICDSKGKSDSSTIQRLGEPEADWIYVYELTSKCACPNGCASPNTGLSIGSIICILFSLAVILYFVVGGVFMKFVRGAEGKEVIPNVNIWMDFPMLVKDGCLFLVGCGKSSGYNDI